MHKVLKITKEYLNNDDIDGAINLIFKNEEEIKNEITKFKESPDNYKFEHIQFIYDFEDLLPFCVFNILIIFSIKHNKLNFLEYLLLDKRVIGFETKYEDCSLIADYIECNLPVNQSLYNFFNNEHINKHIKEKQPELYDIAHKKINLLNIIQNF